MTDDTKPEPAEDGAIATIQESAAFDDGTDAEDELTPEPSPIPGAKTP